MRVLVAVYGSVGGCPSGHGMVRVLEGGVDEATDPARLGGHRCRQGSSLDLPGRPGRDDRVVDEGRQRRGRHPRRDRQRAGPGRGGRLGSGRHRDHVRAAAGAVGCARPASQVPARPHGEQMAGAYRGEAKTDARDAYVIAETLRHRGDLAEVELATSLVSELRLLVTHRSDLVGDRVRMVNRLRDVLSDYFPALERSFDYAHSRGALLLLTGYQTPQAIRRGSATLGCGRGWSSGR